MKLEIQEAYLIGQALKGCTIKGSDAPVMASTILKIEKEFDRLQKLEDKKN
jgi:hypothetical protein